jgi:hypothetical protein
MVQGKKEGSCFRGEQGQEKGGEIQMQIQKSKNLQLGQAGIENAPGVIGERNKLRSSKVWARLFGNAGCGEQRLCLLHPILYFSLVTCYRSLAQCMK